MAGFVDQLLKPRQVICEQESKLDQMPDRARTARSAYRGSSCCIWGSWLSWDGLLDPLDVAFHMLSVSYDALGCVFDSLDVLYDALDI